MSGTQPRPRLQLRGSSYVYRRRVPADLVGRLARCEIVRSLGTVTLTEARRRAAVLDAAVYGLFDRVRGERKGVEEERLIERLCAQYKRQLMAEDRQHRRRYAGDPEAESGGFLDALERESESLQLRRLDHVREDAAGLLAREGVLLGGDALSGLLWELARTRLEAFRQMIQERHGDFVGRPREVLAVDTAGSAPNPSARPSKMLSEVIRLYIEDHEGKKWAPRSATMAKTGLAQFLEVVRDRPVGEVTRDDIRHYRTTLEKLPAHIKTSPRYRSK